MEETTPGPRLQLSAEGLGYPGRPLSGPFQAALHGPGLWILGGDPGCGKSSLLRTLAGAPPRGLRWEKLTARLDTADLLRLSSRERAAAVYYAFQEPADQMVGLDVEGEVAFRLENLGIAEEELPLAVERALDATGLTSLARRAPSDLSGGEARRVTLACALALDAPLVLLDEPTASLDPLWRRRLAADVARLARHRLIIAAEHRAPELATFAKGALRMEGGRIARLPAAWMIQAPQTASVPIPRLVPASGAAAIPAPSPISVHTPVPTSDHTPTPAAPAPPQRASLSMLRLGLQRPDGRPLVSSLSLRLGAGLVGVAGPNGAGKTSLLRHIAGIGDLPSRGVVRARGPTRLVFQRARDAFFRDTLAEELATGTPHGPRSPQVAREAERWGLRHLLDHDPYRLSGGEAQMAAVANALLAEPYMLLLDEPTHGLGPRELARLTGRLRELAHERLILVATHDDVFLSRCDQLLLLSGRGGWMAGPPGRLTDAARRSGYALDAPRPAMAALDVQEVLA